MPEKCLSGQRRCAPRWINVNVEPFYHPRGANSRYEIFCSAQHLMHHIRLERLKWIRITSQQLMAAATAAPVPLQRVGSFPASLTPTHFTNFISFTPLPSSSTRSPRKGCGPIHRAGNHPTIGPLWPHQGRCVTQSGPLKSKREHLTLLSSNQHPS